MHPNQIHTWKKQLVDGAAQLFEDRRTTRIDSEQRAAEAELFEQIGRLKMELEWIKKKLPSSPDSRRGLIAPQHPQLSVRRQCEMLGLPRSTYYFEPATETPENLAIMLLIDKQHLCTPF